jgi:hypothetical protein
MEAKCLGNSSFTPIHQTGKEALHQRSINRKPPGSIHACGVSKVRELLECLLAALNVEYIHRCVIEE